MSSAGKSIHRFFVPPECIDQDAVTISGMLVHQLYHVLRMTAGDHIIVLDNSGWEYKVELKTIEPRLVKGVVKGRNLATGEPRTSITIYQAMLKANKFDVVLQKCTEIGVVGKGSSSKRLSNRGGQDCRPYTL